MVDYNVVEVINQNLIAINAGSADGISADLTFRIIYPYEITDPNNSDETLGTLEIIYGVASVIDIQSAFTTLWISRLTAPEDIPEELWDPDGWVDTNCIVREET